MNKALIGRFKEEKFELNRVLLKHRECENYQQHIHKILVPKCVHQPSMIII